jgi:hypothetical protein
MSLRGWVPPDPHTGVSEVRYAVIYVPRRSRSRFPQSCVEVKDSLQEAMAAADPASKRYAARVAGPSKSSEGQYLYYLVDWLGPEA